LGESWATRRARWAFNWFPAYRGTGARIEYIAADWLEVRVRLPLSWRTRNYVGSIFGGSLYGAVDPVYMLMLIHALGPEYIVWDKAAVIRFIRPGRTTLRATFRVTPEILEEIRQETRLRGKLDRDFAVSLTDAAGVVHATCVKTVYVRWKGFEKADTPA
jgi:acyl-coenzyme A thioesterase PaaI-like protein